MMEVKNLMPVVLLFVLVGMMIGVGVLALDKFGVAVKTSTPVANESVTIASATGSLTYDDVTAFSDFHSINGSIGLGNLTKNVDVNISTAGVVTVNAAKISDGSVNISYTYDADSAATTAAFSGRDEVSNIGTVWMGLIVTIIVLAIIITLVMRSFGANR